MKILMFGRGAVPSLYGWALSGAGHPVEFYTGPGSDDGTAPTVGLEILDARTNPRGIYLEEAYSPVSRNDFSPDHGYDLIIVSVRHDRFAEAAEFLGHRTAGATVLVLGNHWDDPRETGAALPADRLVWGFPGAGGSVDDDGILQGALLPAVHFGTFGTDPTDRDLAVRSLFREAGFSTGDHRDFLGWLRLQFTVNAGLSAQAFTAGSAEALVGSPVHLREAILNVRELFAVAAASGTDLKGFRAETGPFLFPAWLGGWVLQNTLRNNEPYRLILERSTDEEEQKLLCQAVLAAARKLGVSVPRLESRESLFRN